MSLLILVLFVFLSSRKHKEIGSVNGRIQETFGDICSDSNNLHNGSELLDSKSDTYIDDRKESSAYLEHNGSEVLPDHRDEYTNHNGEADYKDISEINNYCRDFSPGFKQKNGDTTSHSSDTMRPNTQPTGMIYELHS